MNSWLHVEACRLARICTCLHAALPGVRMACGPKAMLGPPPTLICKSNKLTGDFEINLFIFLAYELFSPCCCPCGGVPCATSAGRVFLSAHAATASRAAALCCWLWPGCLSLAFCFLTDWVRADDNEPMYIYCDFSPSNVSGCFFAVKRGVAGCVTDGGEETYRKEPPNKVKARLFASSLNEFNIGC